MALSAALPTACAAADPPAPPDRVLSERLCAECAITMDNVLSIPRGDVSDQLFLAAGPDGTVVGVDWVMDPPRVLLFGPDGSIAADADIRHLFPAGKPFFSVDGDVVVPDGHHGVFQVLTTSLEPVRTFRAVENPGSSIVLSGGTVVVSAPSASAERLGYALHVLERADDGVIATDGSSMRILTGTGVYEPWRYLAPRDGRSFWSLHADAYMIELWDTSAGRTRSLRRDAPWFVRRRAPSLARLTPPPTDPMGLAADSDGLLWVLFSVADPEWAGYDLPRWEPGQRGEPSYPGLNRHLQDGVFDSVIEVVDPESGLVIARAQYDEYFSGFAGPNVIVHYDGASNDSGNYRLLRLSLIRAEASAR